MGNACEDVEIYSIGGLILGNATNTYTYICIYMMESTGTDVNTINSEHIRCRGIPTSCISYKAHKGKIVV